MPIHAGSRMSTALVRPMPPILTGRRACLRARSQRVPRRNPTLATSLGQLSPQTTSVRSWSRSTRRRGESALDNQVATRPLVASARHGIRVGPRRRRLVLRPPAPADGTRPPPVARVPRSAPGRPLAATRAPAAGRATASPSCSSAESSGSRRSSARLAGRAQARRCSWGSGPPCSCGSGQTTGTATCSRAHWRRGAAAGGRPHGSMHSRARTRADSDGSPRATRVTHLARKPDGRAAPASAKPAQTGRAAWGKHRQPLFAMEAANLRNRGRGSGEGDGSGSGSGTGGSSASGTGGDGWSGWRGDRRG